MKKRKLMRRSVAEWQTILDAQSRSGQTQAEFCKTKSICLASFQNAKKRVQQAKFVEVSPPVVSGWESELVFPNGVTVRVRGM